MTVGFSMVAFNKFQVKKSVLSNPEVKVGYLVISCVREVIDLSVFQCKNIVNSIQNESELQCELFPQVGREQQLSSSELPQVWSQQPLVPRWLQDHRAVQDQQLFLPRYVFSFQKLTTFQTLIIK